MELKYDKSDFERQHYALLALMCIYGIELLPDNIAEWGYLSKGKFQRRDFSLKSLTQMSDIRKMKPAEQASGLQQSELFAEIASHEVIQPTADYPPMTVRELAIMVPEPPKLD